MIPVTRTQKLGQMQIKTETTAPNEDIMTVCHACVIHSCHALHHLT